MISSVFQSFKSTKANVHDIYHLEDVKNQVKNFVVLGDKAYLSICKQLDLFESANKNSKTSMRRNQPYIFRKSRKKIETMFSQLCDQFNKK